MGLLLGETFVGLALVGLVAEGQFSKNLLALWSQKKQHYSLVCSRTAAFYQAFKGQPVHQFDRAVVLNLQSLGHRSNGWAHSFG